MYKLRLMGSDEERTYAKFAKIDMGAIHDTYNSVKRVARNGSK